jgi:hypothetical protein
MPPEILENYVKLGVAKFLFTLLQNGKIILLYFQVLRGSQIFVWGGVPIETSPKTISRAFRRKRSNETY